jgi:hypothetical protein
MESKATREGVAGPSGKMGVMRRVAVLAPLALVLALTGCSSKSDHDAADLASPGATASAPASAAPSTAATASSAAAPSASAAPRASASQQPPAPGPQRTATTAPGRTAPSRATAAGTYTYDASGSQRTGAYSSRVSSTATLVVSAVRAGRQTSTLHNAQGDTQQEILVRDAGSYLADLKIKAPGLPEKEFAFAKAVLLLPDPARVGASWSWGGRSTDGKTTVATTNKVVRTETLTIGGKAVRTVVLQTHLVLSGDIDYTSDLTTWVAPSLRLPVKDHAVGSGRAFGVAFSFDITDVMRSTVPA